ncbi:MAG: hypothetical protein HQK50_01300 [Oligoflexia bacterium]|nr:hypothetical protein [Oligoflexia bacterium]MBF0364174.1 hypothetical protein [Oligoflexia bacterium]
MNKILLLGMMFCFGIELLASEVDSFTQRYDDIKDSRVALNELVNKELKLAIEESPGCDHKQLYNSVHKRFSTGLCWAAIEYSIESIKGIDRRSISRKDSIYRDFSWWQSPPLFIAKLGDIVRVGDHLVGSDKFGHFFAQGYDYFNTACLKQKGVDAAIIEGNGTESGIFGYYTTGIYSYSDLVSNYQGMFFWIRLFASDEWCDASIPFQGQHYIECRDGQFVQVRDFDFMEFVDAGWDEAMNCNAYWSQKMENAVEKRLQELQERMPELAFRCPIDQSACDYLKIKYHDRLNDFVTPRCL